MLRFGPIACAAAFLTLAGPGLAGPLGRDGAGADGVGIDGYARMVRPEVPERAGSRRVKLGVNKSLVVELPLDAKDILVSNPKIADAVLRTARRAFLIGMEAGQTNIVFFDAGGQQILGLDLQVERDLAALAAMLRKVLPGSDIQPEGVGDGVALAGVVANAADAQKVVEVAARYVGDEKKVVNALTAKGGEQVLLKVTVAEVQRTIVKQLGIDLSGQTNIGSVVLNAGTSNPFMIAGKALSDTAIKTFSQSGCTYTDTKGTQSVNVIDTGFFSQSPRCNNSSSTIRALEQNGLLRTLAEPTLTAISGESASFLAGGEFPVPVGRDNNGMVTIEFKQFGVSLNFTPVVLAEGRISLKVKTEVSELSQDGAFTLSNGSGGTTLSVPSLKTRRADTTVELPSGGSLAIAGLIRDDVKQGISGIPGLLKLPVLGALFKSRDYQRGQTELVVIATPFIARPVARRQLARPDDLQGDQQNRSYCDFGCAAQQNLAAMVEDPADLVSPQPETRPYATRRQEVLGKYGKGDDPSTTYKDAAKGNSSKVGQ